MQGNGHGNTDRDLSSLSCALSLSSTMLSYQLYKQLLRTLKAHRLPAARTAFCSSFCSKKANKRSKGKTEIIRPRCCVVHSHFTHKRDRPAETFYTTSKREQLFGSEAKSWRCNAPAAHYTPRCEVSSCCIWLHANVHWLVLVTLEADWPL